MYGDVFLIEREGARPFQAERLALGETSGRNEAWLRDMLFENPNILPLDQIDPSYGPLIPLCKELRTAAGPVDIAFINRHGQLTLVECKLWRNPEARRKVVAQLLDYARAVSTWSYSDLQRQVAAATGLKGNVPFSKVSCEHDEVVEQRFIDSAYRALRNGRFLLLIAGDGIRDDAEAVRWYRVAAAQGHASAQCNFGIRYANGEGVPQDHAEAVRWFRLALEDCPVFVYIYGLPVELWAQAS